MSDFKEFQGKTLDAAISEACAYYDAPREKMEIDIIEDAKTGIFGLVGARKARIRARRVQLQDMLPQKPNKNDKARGRKQESAPVENAPAPHNAEKTEDGGETSQTESGAAATSDIKPQSETNAVLEPATEAPAKQGRRRSARNAPDGQAQAPQREAESETGDDRQDRRQPLRGKRRKPEDAEGARLEHDADGPDMALPRVNLSELDQDKLRAVTTKMIRGLVLPILGEEEPALEIRMSDDRVHVQIQCEDTGLLIGRDGQNLAAVQYLATRMITRAMSSQVRVQVDAGDYHTRQDTRLQELALGLAEKVRATGKPQATRSLSAYQRRVIHLALQDDPDVQTRSSGEGALKRVVIQRKKD